MAAFPRNEHKRGFMWLENLKELKKSRGISCAQISIIANIPEKTVSRIFSGETPAPRIDNICDIIKALDGSLDEIFEIFKNSKAVIGYDDVSALQNELLRTKSELNSALDLIEDLRKDIRHREEIIELYKLLVSRNTENAKTKE